MFFSSVSTYYDVLKTYMQTLFGLTINAAKGDEKGVALQAIVFWSSICHEEIDRKGSKAGEASDSDPHSLFIDHVAGGTCLGLVARTVDDAGIPCAKKNIY
ncbi:putative armadillo-like helical, importin beta family [Helianthus debilis subsp. tardiflorus]